MKQDQDSLKKVRIITYAVTAILAVVIAVGSVAFATYQRNQKREQQKQAQMAAALQKQQLANVEAIKATLPLFRETAKGENKIMVKVRQEYFPQTFTAESTGSSCQAVPPPQDDPWSLTLNGSVIAHATDPNGWSVTSGGEVSGPASPAIGIYTVEYATDEPCSDEFTSSGTTTYSFTFKVIPPCPTSVTLTHVDN